MAWSVFPKCLVLPRDQEMRDTSEALLRRGLVVGILLTARSHTLLDAPDGDRPLDPVGAPSDSLGAARNQSGKPASSFCPLSRKHNERMLAARDNQGEAL